MEYFSRTPNHRLQLTFLSVPGEVYSVACATDLAQAPWQTCLFALSDTGAVQESVAEGNGDWLSFYIPIGGPAWFFRIEVQ